MSSSIFGGTIDLAPRPSVRALTVLFGLHLAVLILLLAALRPGAPMAVLAVGVAGSWMWTRRHPAFGFGKRALIRLTWHAAGGWSLQDASGAHFDAELLGSSLVHERLLVLSFRLKVGGRRSRALLGDEVDGDLLRRLRARLSLERGDPEG